MPWGCSAEAEEAGEVEVQVIRGSAHGVADDAREGLKESPNEALVSEPPQLPWRLIVALCLCNAAHFYSVCSLFSYAGIMSADLGWAVDRDHAGQIAGFLASANTLGRIPTGYFWGMFAERRGLKTATLAALGFIGAGGIAFGLCTDPLAAIVTRFLFLGAGNGWVALWGPMSLEYGGERQTELTGKVFASGCLVQLIGPAVGGWTYGLVGRFPAALPSGLGTLLSVAAAFATVWWIPPDSCKGVGVKAARSGSEQNSLGAALCKKPLPLITFLRCGSGCLNFAFFEVVPLWAISTLALGGLQLSENEVGLVLSSSAIGTALFIAYLMPRLTKAIGLRRAMALASSAGGIGLAAMPWMKSRATLAFLVMVGNSAYATLGAAQIASMNNIVPKSRLARVNGVTVSLEALAKGLGPMSSAAAFAWTLSRLGRAGHSLVFLLMAAVHLLIVAGSLSLPESVERRAEEEEVGGASPESKEEERPAAAAPVRKRPEEASNLLRGAAEAQDVPTQRPADDGPIV